MSRPTKRSKEPGFETALGRLEEIVRTLEEGDLPLETSLRLAARIPSGVVKVAESGIHSASDVRRLHDAGFHAFLVGEHLMKAPSPSAALRARSAASTHRWGAPVHQYAALIMAETEARRR